MTLEASKGVTQKKSASLALKDDKDSPGRAKLEKARA